LDHEGNAVHLLRALAAKTVRRCISSVDSDTTRAIDDLTTDEYRVDAIDGDITRPPILKDEQRYLFVRSAIVHRDQSCGRRSQTERIVIG
jgi:hypothetical protein